MPQDSGWTSSRTDLVIAASLLLLAAVTRAAISAATPIADPISDMSEYWTRAVHLYEHGRLYPDTWRMPGLPITVAAALELLGRADLSAVRLVNIVAGGGAAVLTYALARRSAAPRPAAVAGLVVALYPSFLAYTSLVATETLVTLPLLGALLAASFASRRAMAVAGLLAAATVLVRPAGIALLPAIVAAPWFVDRPATTRTRLAAAGMALLTFTLTMAPWWYHGVQVHGRVVALDTTGGLNLLLGNGPDATGLLKTGQLLRLQREQLRGIDVTTPAGADRAARLALDHARAHPMDTLRLVPAKLAGLFALEGREHAYLYSVGLFGELRGFTLRGWAAAVMLSFPLLLAAALFGLGVPSGLVPSVRGPAVCYLAVAVLMHLLTFGEPRFHLPFVPVLAVFATALAHWPRYRAAPQRVFVAAAVLSVLAMVWTAQVPAYLRALEQLAAPGGSSHALDYDTLL